MSRFIDAESDAVLDIEQAKAEFARLALADLDFPARAATILVGLYNNRRLLPAFLGAVLANDGHAMFYSPQSFYIGTGAFADGGRFVLRGNVWFPPSFHDDIQALEDSVYSYDNCHDHNFDFYTVGYAGPGYLTDLYEYDAATMSGVVGEKVALRSAGTVTLSPGKVLHFRKGVDIHMQRYPASLSVSVNLLIHDDAHYERGQYEFDPATGRVQSTIYSTSMYPASLAFLAGELGCTDAVRSLYEAMRSSSMWQHRFAAGRALLAVGAHNDAAALQAHLQLPQGASLSQAYGVY
jgi:hypothetical protein